MKHVPLLGLLIAVGFLTWMGLDVGFDLLAGEFLKANAGLLFLAVAIVLLNPLWRALMLQIVLERTKHITIPRLYSAVVVGVLGSLVLPSKTGMLFRAYFISTREGISFAAAMSVGIIEWAFQKAAVVAVAVLALAVLPIDQPLARALVTVQSLPAGMFLIGGALTAIFVLVAWTMRRKLHSVQGQLLTVVASLNSIKAVGSLTALGLINWLTDIGIALLVGLAFGLPAYTPHMVLGVIAFMTTSNLVSMLVPSQSGLGAPQIIAIAVFVAMGVPKEVVTGYTVAMYAVTSLPVLAVGMTSLWAVLGSKTIIALREPKLLASHDSRVLN